MARKLALVIGNSQYEDQSLALLAAPIGDVNALVDTLRAPEIGAFDNVIALIDQPSAVVRRAIARFFREETKPDDLLLLYFSGHGVLDDQGRLYLAVKDTERKLLSGTAIRALDITGEMDDSRSRRKLLILDCCHSGAFARGTKGAVGATVGTGPTFEGNGSGRVVLTATDSTQYAWEGDQVIGMAENSVFTHYLIQGLQTGEADRDHDGKITIDELYDYVYANVVDATSKQTPHKWSYNQQGEIVIAGNPHGVRAATLPPELRQAIESPFVRVRAGAVGELDALLRGSDRALALAAYEALQALTNDDSRTVCALASETLKAYGQPLAPGEGRGRDAPETVRRKQIHEAAEIEVSTDSVTTTSPEQQPSVRDAAVLSTRQQEGVRQGMQRPAALLKVVISSALVAVPFVGLTMITLNFLLESFYWGSSSISRTLGMVLGGSALLLVATIIFWSRGDRLVAKTVRHSAIVGIWIAILASIALLNWIYYQYVVRDFGYFRYFMNYGIGRYVAWGVALISLISAALSGAHLSRRAESSAKHESVSNRAE